jgi:RNA polymerase sigma-70 factor (ECF subfamily)
VESSFGANSENTAIFERERRHLLSIAFRILGSQADAEDVVQEAWIRFASAGTSEVHNVPAWLTTVATRLCLDLLRRRREAPEDTMQLREDRGDEPEEVALLAEELTAAFVVVLEELTPPQRVALVLHDAFGVSFEEIAHILETSAASAKKSASRARGRIRERVKAPPEDLGKARKVVEAFLHAAQEGDTQRLVSLLAPNVVRLADAQVLPKGANQRVQGLSEVVSQTLLFRSSAARARTALIDSRPGIIVLAGDTVQFALIVRVEGERIVQYDVVADPQRLASLRIDR